MNIINIKSVEELVDSINRIPSNYVFRGHAQESWTLQSSIKRIFAEEKNDEEIKRIETYCLSQFKSKFHLYDTTNKSPSTTLEWLSLMQHYGVPTRLLDFTESPYVALYFAIETFDSKQDEDFAIYGVDYRNILRKSIEEIKRIDNAFPYSYEDAQLKQDEIYEDVIDRFSYDIIWVTEPKKVNLRLDRQAGCFLLSCNLCKTIEEILQQSPYSPLETYKFIVPRTYYENIYELLRKANITSKVIYGDVGGLAKSIRMAVTAHK